MTCNECIHKAVCYRVDSVPSDYAQKCGDFVSGCKALDQEPCTDAVSRQAVLDGIDELKKSPWATDKRGNGFEYLIAEALDVVADLCVKKLPPVNPTSNVSIQITEREKYGRFN